MSTPKRRVVQRPFLTLGIIVTVSLTLGLVLPGTVASIDGVLTLQTFQQHIPTQARRELENYRHRLSLTQSNLARAESSLSNSAKLSSGQLSLLLSLRNSYSQQLKGRPPISLQPYLGHIIMYFWPVMYCCLLTIICFMRPPHAVLSVRVLPSLALLAIGIFLFDIWPLWARTALSLLSNQGRVVYAYSNYDIDKWSFFVQQLNFFVFAVLLAIIWRVWYESFLVKRGRAAQDQHTPDVLAPFDPRSLAAIYNAFARWLVSFLILGIGFGTYTAIFWTQIIRNDDLRFIYEAIVVHALWLTTIILLFLPFNETWQAWHWSKMRARATLLSSGMDGATLQTTLDALENLEPIGPWRIGAAVFSVFSVLVAPIAQTFLK